MTARFPRSKFHVLVTLLLVMVARARITNAPFSSMTV